MKRSLILTPIAAVLLIAIAWAANETNTKSKPLLPGIGTSRTFGKRGTGSGDLSKPPDVKQPTGSQPSAMPATEPTVEPVLAPAGSSQPATSSAAGGGGIVMNWYSINQGGAINIGTGSIRMGVSVAQPVAGEVSTATRKMGLGFWYGAGGGAAPCACDCHADPECNGIIVDIGDIVVAVDVIFRGIAATPDPNPSCPRQRVDVNCDTFMDILDIPLLVDVAFRGFTAQSRFCDPCAAVVAAAPHDAELPQSD